MGGILESEKLKHASLGAVVAVVTAVVLLLSINQLMGGPVHELATAGLDARADAVKKVVAAAGWSAFVAAASAFLGALLAIGDGMFGAAAKGVNVGAATALLGASYFVAAAASVS